MRPPSVCRRCGAPVAGSGGLAVRLRPRACAGCARVARLCGRGCLAAWRADPRFDAHTVVEVLELEEVR